MYNLCEHFKETSPVLKMSCGKPSLILVEVYLKVLWNDALHYMKWFGLFCWNGGCGGWIGIGLNSSNLKNSSVEQFVTIIV